jgi:hypothetical protein
MGQLAPCGVGALHDPRHVAFIGVDGPTTAPGRILIPVHQATGRDRFWRPSQEDRLTRTGACAHERYSLAGPAAGALRNFAERAAKEILSRPRAQQAWENANRTAHEQLVQVLKGGGPVVSTGGGVVTLDLRELLTELEARTGVGGRVAERLPPSAAQITVMRSDQLEAAHNGFKVLDALPIISVVLSLALFGIALAVAPGWRRQAVRGYGFGLVAAGLAGLATRSLAGDSIVNSLVPKEAESRPHTTCGRS